MEFALFALIGSPLDKTVSHLVHSEVMQKFALNATYLKMKVESESLRSFLTIARTVPFRGLSVTMPLKEAIVPCLDSIDPEAKAIGAVNTVVFEGTQAVGYNTDGVGAIQAIEEKTELNGKRAVIIGAGGAAKAIAYIAKKKGALVTVLNRTVEKAEEIARAFHLEKGKGLDDIAQIYFEGYDVLINCTPAPLPIDPKYILKSAVVMDIATRSQPNSLLACAEKKGSIIVLGRDMWVNQAVLQYRLWFKEELLEIKEQLRKHLKIMQGS